jgi:cation:H+ antiporter
MTYVLLVIGLALLLGGGEALVTGSVAVARRLNVSPLVIGLTLVGFGTSTPELVTSLEAARIGSPGIALGNIIGSNIANILLILGVAAMIFPIAATREAFRRDGGVLVGTSLLMLAVVLFGTIGRGVGLLFLTLLGAYTLYAYFTERQAKGAAARVHEAEAEATVALSRQMALWKALPLAIGGIAAVVLGANLLVDAGVEIARAMGLSETVIGLTLVAVGTSMPELATSVMAAIRRQPDVAAGNIVGSSVFNVLGIAGATALVTPIPVPPEIAAFDIWVMLAATLLLILFVWTGLRLGRREGAVLLLSYVAYLIVQLAPGLRAQLGLA